MNSLLEVKDLNFSYGDRQVLRDISFSVDPGEIVGVSGPSGCGKSTLLYSILRLPKAGGYITGGSIVYGGRELLALSEKEMQRIRGADIGFIAQDSAASFHPVRKTGSQLREMAACHEGITSGKARERFLELAEKMGLDDGEKLLKSYAYELSGGMCQRVAIAIAMAFEPALLLADEPSSSLDSKSGQQVINELLRVRENYGTAILFVSHDRQMLESVSDEVITMEKDGRFICGLQRREGSI